MDHRITISCPPFKDLAVEASAVTIDDEDRGVVTVSFDVSRASSDTLRRFRDGLLLHQNPRVSAKISMGDRNISLDPAALPDIPEAHGSESGTTYTWTLVGCRR